MRLSNLAACAFSVCAVVEILSGCSATQTPAVTPATLRADRVAPASSFNVLYRFRRAQGAWPQASLIDVNGTLYGTTSLGGALRKGTVYTVTTTGTEKVLYSFAGSPDGSAPIANLVNVKGTLYGTTFSGGAGCGFGCGTVYSISPSGLEKVLYRFAAYSDGAFPTSHLLNVKGTLYGATVGGGGLGCKPSFGCGGTVYSISTTGVETVLYRFAGGSDGMYPVGDLINVNGTLYGTTAYGGGSGCVGGLGCGTVYTITTAGVEKVIYRFAGGSDGWHPEAGLIDVNGTLYGTTDYGGIYSLCGGGCGTVFSISTSGNEHVLYRFGDSPDGAEPRTALINVKGTLYGATFEGGGSGCLENRGCGTVYSLSTNGTETVVHSFGATNDGGNPAAALFEMKGSLYGTAENGGGGQKCAHVGCGVVFQLQP
jgi:uncharacterized repeat protein (TIGR03803 family)